MTTLKKSVALPASADRVWDAARDIGALHSRLVPGFVTSTVVDGEVRTVTFANGVVVQEAIVSCDDASMRLCWTTLGGRASHYNAVLEVKPAPATQPGCVVTWTIDLLPHEMAGAIGGMQDAGLAAMTRAFPG